MTSIKVTSHLDVLAVDMAKIPPKARREMYSTVREAIRVGNIVARDNARISSGRHGKHYPNAFSAELNESLFGATSQTISGEYGPDAAKPQGGMSFEWGSRNQKPHLDLNRSADLMGPTFADEVGRIADRLFW